MVANQVNAPARTVLVTNTSAISAPNIAATRPGAAPMRVMVSISLRSLLL